MSSVMLNVYRTVVGWGKVSIENGEREGTREAVYAKRYTREFQLCAARLAIEQGYTQREVAERLGR